MDDGSLLTPSAGFPCNNNNNNNNNKTCNAHISTLLGVQGAVKPKTKQKQNKNKTQHKEKTDTTKLVIEKGSHVSHVKVTQNPK